MKLSLIKIVLLGASGLLLASVAPAMAQDGDYAPRNLVGTIFAPQVISRASDRVSITVMWKPPCADAEKVMSYTIKADYGDIGNAPIGRRSKSVLLLKSGKDNPGDTIPDLPLAAQYVIWVVATYENSDRADAYSGNIIVMARNPSALADLPADTDKIFKIENPSSPECSQDKKGKPKDADLTEMKFTALEDESKAKINLESPQPDYTASRAAWRGSGRGMLSSALDVLTDYVLEMEYPLPVRAGVQRELAADAVLPFGDSGERDVAFGEVLGASEFRLSLTPRTTQTQHSRADFSVWGAGDVRGYQVDDKTAGHNYAGYVGADVRGKRWSGGVAASYTNAQSGDVSNWFASAYPYLRFAPHEQIEFWLLAGAGFGRHDAQDIDTDLLYHFYAGGLRVRSRSLGGVRFGLKTDAAGAFYQSLGLPKENDPAKFAFREQRWRLSGQMNYDWRLGAASVRPSLEISARVDSTDGDAPTIAGEGAAGLRLAYAGFSLDARGRALLANDAGELIFSEWGGSVSARLGSNSNGEGLALALTPSWDLARAQLNAEMSYGIRRRAVLLAPFVQYRLSEGGQGEGGQGEGGQGEGSHAAGLGSRLLWRDGTLLLLAERGVDAADYRLTARLSLRPRFGGYRAAKARI